MDATKREKMVLSLPPRLASGCEGLNPYVTSVILKYVS